METFPKGEFAVAPKSLCTLEMGGTDGGLLRRIFAAVCRRIYWLDALSADTLRVESIGDSFRKCLYMNTNHPIKVGLRGHELILFAATTRGGRYESVCVYRSGHSGFSL